MPHIELTREIARRFNQNFGNTFPEPEAMLSNAPRLPGIDNRMMHTSYGNAIFLRDTEDEATRKVMSMYTDPTRLHSTDPGHVEGNPVFALLDIFHSDKDELAQIKSRYEMGNIGDVEIKRLLAKSLNAGLAPLRERRATLLNQPDLLLDALYGGTARAKIEAKLTLEDVYQRMGLSNSRV